MASYQVRSRVLLDMMNDVKTGRLILSPYFQRELVWRKTHKQDFITTILLGYPFPQIFISRGTIDVERMITTSLIVDGQQRMAAIQEFINGGLDVGGRQYNQLSPVEKENFLKYEIPVIDLDLSDNDPRLKEIFWRLNRTFYSLTEIERLSTEYSTSEFMLVAKLLTGQIESSSAEDDSLSVDIGFEDNDESGEKEFGPHKDPNIPQSFWIWAESQNVDKIRSLLLDMGIFTAYELARQVHLIFTLNVLSTVLGEAFFSRNSKTREFLDEYKESVPQKELIVNRLNEVAGFIHKIGFNASSYWMNKANIFTLIVLLYEKEAAIVDLDAATFRSALDRFAETLPHDYQLAAKEAVNRKRERVLRNNRLDALLFEDVL